MIKNKTLKYILIIIIIIYIVSYYVSNSGYYEYHIQKETILTNEKIKEFENDVKKGEAIDTKNYLIKNELEYSNKLSNIVYEISDKGTKITRKIIKALFKKLSYLVED